ASGRHAAPRRSSDLELDPRLGGGVGFTGDDDLTRAIRIQKEAAETFGIAEHEREALVGGHAAGETDGERVLLEHPFDPTEFGGGRPAFDPGAVHPPASLAHDAGAHLATPLPPRGVGGAVLIER